MKLRNSRHDVVKSIIRTQRISTQKMLVEALNEAGYPCTQATVSRDVKDLSLRKFSDGHYVLPEDLHLQRMVHDLVLEITAINNLLIIKAQTGTAPGVAAALDDVAFEGIAGTISGDDTILLVAKDSDSAKDLSETLSSFLESKKKSKSQRSREDAK